MANKCNDNKKSIVFSDHFTDKKGVVHYAWEYGYKAFPLRIRRKKTKK